MDHSFNDTWDATGNGGDCEIVWTMVGSTRPTKLYSFATLVLLPPAVSTEAEPLVPTKSTLEMKTYRCPTQFASESGESSWYFSASVILWEPELGLILQSILLLMENVIFSRHRTLI